MKNLLTKDVAKSYGMQDAQMVGNIIGLVIGLILAVAVLLPVTQEVISSLTGGTTPIVTGTAATIVDVVLPVVAIIPIALIAAYLM